MCLHTAFLLHSFDACCTGSKKHVACDLDIGLSSKYDCLCRPACLCNAGSEDDARDDDQTQDLLAANLGIDHFSVMLRRSNRQEEADAQGNVKRPK